MKMNISPLQLDFYFVSDFHFSLNKEFRLDGKPAIRDEDVLARPEAVANPQDKSKWTVTLNIKHEPPSGINSPYLFDLKLVGFFRIHPDYPGDRIERLVQTNGASMLYGIAREMVREMTGRGPYFSVFLPSISFFEPVEKAQIASPETEKEPGKTKNGQGQ